MERKVAIRIGTEGKATVRADFAEIRKDGAGAMQEIAASAKAAGDAGDAQAKRLVTSFDRATADLEAAARRQAAAAAKIASITPKSAVQMQVEASAGTTARGGVVEQDLANRTLGQYEGTARASALAFRELFAEQEANERAAMKLKAAIDPLFAAEQQLARSLAEVAAAEKAGVVSADLLTEARRRAQAAFDDTRQAVADAASGTKLGENADAQVRAYYTASAAEAEKAQAAALRLKASIDPLWAAEQKLEVELRQVALAEKAGVLSADQLAEAQRRARKEFDETTNAIKRQSGAGGGLSRNQKQTLLYTASDIVGSSANGINPGQLLIQQGPQVLQAFAAEEGGLRKIAALVSPVALGIGGITAATLVGAAAWLDYTNATDKLDALAQGIGRASGTTAEQVRASAEAAADAANISIAAAQEIAQGYLASGKITGDVLTGLTSITDDFAAAMGIDAKAAVQQLGAAFSDPSRGAEELNTKLGILDQAGVDYIRTLIEQNKLTEAQIALFHSLVPAIDGAAEHINVMAQGWKNVKNWASEAGSAIGKALDRAAGNLPVLEQMADLDRKIAAARAGRPTGYAGNAAIYEDLSALQKQRDALAYEVRQDAARVAQGKALAGRQQAQSLVDQFTGRDQITALLPKIQQVKEALAAGVPADQRKGMEDYLAALNRGYSSFIPKQQQVAELAANDARLAAARTPAQKAEIAADRVRIEQKGKLSSVSEVEALATAAGTKAKLQAAGAGAGHAATLAREAAAIAINTKATGDLTDAYLKSSAAGFEAEARRKALTEATRRGVDVEARVRAQLALSVADAAATGAKSIAQLRDETAARKDINDRVSGGTLAVAAMSAALADESTLRGLIAAQLVAKHLDAEGEAYKRLTAEIGIYRTALAEARTEQQRQGAVQASSSIDEDIVRMRAEAEYAGDRSGKGAIEIARLMAEREASNRFPELTESDPERSRFVENSVSQARTRRSTDNAKYLADMRNNQADQLEMSQAELAVVGKNEDARAAILDRLRVELDLRSRNVDLASDEAKAVLAGVDAQAQANTKLKLAAASMDEIRGFASDLLDPSNWDNWRDAGSSALSALKQEFIKLALVNPLKNLLSGSSALPTLTSALGGIGKLFGGGSSGLSSAITKAPSLAAGVNFSNYPSLGFNAGGTEYWSGGATWVGENGPELVSAPRGSRITPAAQARQMVTPAHSSAPVANHFHFEGAVMTQDLVDQMNAIGASSAMRGAAGGAEMAKRDFARAARFRLAR